MLLWRLILAQLISDFILQNNWMIKNKARFAGLDAHGLINIGVSLIAVIDILTPQLFVLIIILGFIHTMIDLLKNLLGICCKKMNWLWFLTDQGLHVSTIILGAGLVSPDCYNYITNFWSGIDRVQILQYASLIIFNLMGGMYFTGSVTEKYKPEENTDPHDAHALIGVFERFLITLSVLIGRFEIIGFMIAAKSIIRLPEARTLDKNSDERAHKMVNYYLIGTFVSYSWAIAFTLLFIRFIR